MNSSSCSCWSRVFFSPPIFSGNRRRAFLLSLALGLAGCGQKAAGPPPRYAVLRFENLSGDAALEWTGRATAEVLTRTLSGALDGPVIARTAVLRLGNALGPRPVTVPGISTERTAAESSGATHLIVGYIEKIGAGVRIVATDTDLASGKVVRTLSSADQSPLKALTGLSGAFSPKAGKPQTQSEEALRFYSMSREQAPDQAMPSLESAVKADPRFGDAWVALAESLEARGNRQAAEDVIARARQQQLEPLDTAYLDFQSATLQGNHGGLLNDLKRISDLSPGDTALIRSLAEAQISQGLFAEAAASWKKLAQVIPNDPDALNQLGYSLAWNGDYPGAVAAMKNYARIRPNEPNPGDSLGDVYYMYRKFPEAAQVYLQNHSKFPGFLEGGELYKAAWAEFLAGDAKGADTTFAQYRKLREKAPGTALAEADWHYRTGRRKEAVTELRKAVDETENPAEKAVFYSQLAVWDLLAGDRAAADRDSKAIGTPTTPAAFLVRFTALPSASVAEWEARAKQMLPAPGAAPLQKLAVAYALMLDGKRGAAMPLWKQISEEAKPTDFAMLAAWPMLKGEQPKLALVPDSGSLNSFAAALEKR
jgi:tetratricopeptide (TPR) repeat protein/TolB-like protein